MAAAATDYGTEFLKLGMPPIAVAGLLGNIQQESGFNVRASGDGGAAKGLLQLHPDRQANFKKLTGTDIINATPAQIAEFVHYEFNGGDKIATAHNAEISAAKTPAEAAALIDKYYFRSDQKSTRQRQANAEAASSLLGGNTGGGGAIEIGKPIGTPKPAASTITPEKKLARDTAVQNLYDLVVEAREAGHLVADEQSYIANRTQEARRGRTYLPGGTAQKTSLDSLEATTAQILRQFIQQGTSGTLNSNVEQNLFLKSVGGADSTYDARMAAIRNFAQQNGVQLNDYARRGAPSGGKRPSLDSFGGR
jgi:hypothetical protein